MVPPMWVRLPSGMNMTAGCGVPSSNSVLFAPAFPSTSRAKSMTAICKPRQMPRYGFPDSRQYRAAHIFPSTPRFPNPPGTNTPSASLTICQNSSCWSGFSLACSGTRYSASTQSIFIFAPALNAACWSALMTLR